MNAHIVVGKLSTVVYKLEVKIFNPDTHGVKTARHHYMFCFFLLSIIFVLPNLPTYVYVSLAPTFVSSYFDEDIWKACDNNLTLMEDIILTTGLAFALPLPYMF